MIIANRTLLVLMITFFGGCHQQHDFVFKEETSLKGVEIKVNAILNPRSLIVYDSLLLIKERPKTQKSIKILNLNDFSLISNAVWLGRGPGELVNPANMVIDKENGVLWYSDWGKYKSFKFPIDSLVLNPDFKSTESFTINKGLIPMMNMFYHHSGNFGFTSFNIQKNLVSFIDIKGEQIDSMAIPNKIYDDIWEDAGYSDNPLILHYNLTHEKIVVASRFKNNITVIDEQGNPSFQIQGNPVEGKSNYRTFYQIDSDEEFIYCIYKGGVIQEYDKELERGVVYYPNRLLVFDWQGVGRFDITLDHPLKFFALDKERKRIIGNTESLDNGLIMYNLEWIYNR